LTRGAGQKRVPRFPGAACGRLSSRTKGGRDITYFCQEQMPVFAISIHTRQISFFLLTTESASFILTCHGVHDALSSMTKWCQDLPIEFARKAPQAAPLCLYCNSFYAVKSRFCSLCIHRQEASMINLQWINGIVEEKNMKRKKNTSTYSLLNIAVTQLFLIPITIWKEYLEKWNELIPVQGSDDDLYILLSHLIESLHLANQKPLVLTIDHYLEYIVWIYNKKKCVLDLKWLTIFLDRVVKMPTSQQAQSRLYSDIFSKADGKDGCFILSVQEGAPDPSSFNKAEWKRILFDRAHAQIKWKTFMKRRL